MDLSSDSLLVDQVAMPLIIVLREQISFVVIFYSEHGIMV
jgi:hypothetical protein